MFTTFYKVLLGLILIIIIAYFLQNRANTPEACANIEGLWDATEQVCKTPTEKLIFQSLSKPNPVSIVLPQIQSENQTSVVLDKVELVDETVYFRGDNNNLSKATYKREIVYLNMSQLMLLMTNTKGLTYFAAPFIVNNENNDAYVYAGLFSYDFNSHQAKHLDSKFLGNHIRETEIELTQTGQVKFTFKSHGPKQVLSDYPVQSNEIDLQLVALDVSNDKQAKFKRLEQMANDLSK